MMFFSYSIFSILIFIYLYLLFEFCSSFLVFFPFFSHFCSFISLILIHSLGKTHRHLPPHTCTLPSSSLFFFWFRTSKSITCCCVVVRPRQHLRPRYISFSFLILLKTYIHILLLKKIQEVLHSCILL